MNERVKLLTGVVIVYGRRKTLGLNGGAKDIEE